MLKEKMSKVDLEIIFPDYADNNFLTIIRGNRFYSKRNYSNEENMSDSSYKKVNFLF